MAGLNIFHYTSGSSILHRHNTLLFFLEFLLLSLVLFNTDGPIIMLFIPFVVFLVILSGIDYASLIRQLKGFIFLGIIIGAAGYYRLEPASVTERLLSGLFDMSRYFVFLLYSIVFIYTRSPRQIYIMIAGLFKFIPFISGRKIASFFLIVFSLLPVVFDTIKDVRESIVSRCGYRGRRVFINTFYTVYPVVVTSLIRSANFADALISRSFTADNTLRQYEKITRTDVIIFIIITMLSVLVFFVQYSNFFDYSQI
ncbi:MAG TPA: energy-coupling factor transporter transmembrane component T [Spirochaetota bacterium]|nr:energy-coupling factor transporter transmembrane component T [Spirochaetota bacterium]